MFKTGANLFTSGDFISHAGLPLKWKIECDAIRPEEWDCLAQMIMEYHGAMPFREVKGIPTGGRRRRTGGLLVHGEGQRPIFLQRD